MEVGKGKDAQVNAHRQAERERKITYHVGWKSGSIGRKHRSASSIMISLMLHEAPLPPSAAFACMLGGATAAAFLTLLYLLLSLLSY